MAGLLDITEDPRQMGLLQLGLGLLNSRGNFGQALGQAGPGALDAMRQATQDQQRKAQQAQLQQMQAIQMQQAQGQLADQQRQAQERQAQDARDEAFRGQLPAPTGAPMASGATSFGAFNINGAADPQQVLLHQALMQRQIKPMEYLAAMQKDKTPIKLGAGETLLEQGTFKPLFTNPKEDSAPSAVKEYQFAKGQGYGGTFQQFQLEQKRAGASNTSVSYGAPVAGIDANGNPVFFQPDKGGGAPSIVQGVAPPKKDNPVEFNKSVSGLKELANGLKSYESTLEQTGGINPLATGEKKAALQGSYTALQMGLKNAFELGALAGPDLALLQGMIVDPTSPKAIMLGTKGVLEQNNKVRQYLKNRGRAVYEAHGQKVPPEYADGAAAAGGTDPLGLRKGR